MFERPLSQDRADKLFVNHGLVILRIKTVKENAMAKSLSFFGEMRNLSHQKSQSHRANAQIPG